MKILVSMFFTLALCSLGFAISNEEMCTDYLSLAELTKVAPNTASYAFCTDLLKQKSLEVHVTDSLKKSLAKLKTITVAFAPYQGGGTMEVPIKALQFETLNCGVSSSPTEVGCSVRVRMENTACSQSVEKIYFSGDIKNIEAIELEVRGFKAEGCMSFN